MLQSLDAAGGWELQASCPVAPAARGWSEACGSADGGHRKESLQAAIPSPGREEDRPGMVPEKAGRVLAGTAALERGERQGLERLECHIQAGEGSLKVAVEDTGCAAESQAARMAVRMLVVPDCPVVPSKASAVAGTLANLPGKLPDFEPEPDSDHHAHQ